MKLPFYHATSLLETSGVPFGAWKVNKENVSYK
jgi:hypothetical protein